MDCKRAAYFAIRETDEARASRPTRKSYRFPLVLPVAPSLTDHRPVAEQGD